METIKASGFVKAGNNLMMFGAPVKVFSGFPEPLDIDSDVPMSARDICLPLLRTLQRDCEGLGLNVTLLKVNRTIEKLETIQLSYRDLASDSRDIFERLNDELDSRLFLAIDSMHVSYYTSFMDGWGNVNIRFSSITGDIEESSKCFALNRYTAVVFHLMRIMEVGLRVLGDTLHDPSLDPKRNPTWDRILQRCRTELAKPLAQRSPEWQQDEPFFSGTSARLMAVKDAWRNPTMHIERMYTEETALDVFNHVQAFMRHLATKLKE